MFAQVTCPTCSQQFGVPEATMGKRITCRNCQSPFVAGKSVAIAVGSPQSVTGPQTPPESGFNKTMIGSEDTLIRYNCPRCKTALEAPPAEAGKKKPCPSCGQRLQVPAAPPPSSPQPGIDKTMLGSDTNGSAAAPDPALNRTMLGGDETNAGPPIRYNCPRCKKALEASASEAQTKKPCPSCGQRHMVPAAPVAAAGINKTMLTGDEPSGPPIRYDCPRCKKSLEASASEAETKKNCPSCGQRHKVPAAPSAGINKTMLASDGSGHVTAQPASLGSPMNAPGGGQQYAQGQQPQMGIWAQHFEGRPMRVVGLGLAALFLFLIVVPSVIRGGKSKDMEAFEKAQAELAQLKADIARKEKLVEQQKKLEEEQRKKWDAMMADMKKREDDLENKRKLAEQNLIFENDLKKKREAQQKLDEEKRDLDRKRADLERKQLESDAKLKAEIAALKTQVENANKQRQNTQTIIQQPPVHYYPPYDYRYYRWWYP